MFVLAILCGNAFAQKVTLDFSDNSVWKLPTDNKTTTEQEFTNNGYTIKLTAGTVANNYYKYNNSTSGILMGKTGATLELPAFDFDVERIDVVGNTNASGAVKQNIFVGDKAVSEETTGAKVTNNYAIDANYQAKGNVYKLKVTNSNNTQILKILVWEKGTAPAITLPEVDNIKDFIALGNGQKGVLKLTNAKVQYAGESDIYITDATGGIDIYKSDFNYKAGQTLNGTITGTYTEFSKLPELTNITESNLTFEEGTVEPVEMTVAEAAKAENVCKLVTIKDITLVALKSGNYTNYYTDAEKTIQIYDKFKLGYDVTVTEPRTFTGIIIPYNTQMELAVTTMPTTTGITTITTQKQLDGKKYNLNGQRVSDDYKGVYIKNGKKYLNK